MYRDITTYSKNDKDRSPRILEGNLNGIKFIVHKHIYYGDDWLLSCNELDVDKLELHTDDMEKAKEVALNKLLELFKNRMEKYEKAINEIKNKSE